MLQKIEGTNIIGEWRPCLGNNKLCENYVCGPYWVCLKCWQLFLVNHGDKISDDEKVHPDIP